MIMNLNNINIYTVKRYNNIIYLIKIKLKKNIYYL